MNKVFTLVLKHLAREFVNHPEVRARAKQLADVGYTKASQLVTEWGAKKKLKVVPSMPADASKGRTPPAKKKKSSRKTATSRKTAKSPKTPTKR